jgi:RNA polymerase sigma-70 factor (ECF subfamily)
VREGGTVTAELLERARAGDREAFALLTEPYRRELQVHCYRFLGSLQDAEDVLQEVWLAAWQGLEGFEGRASVRTWLYRVATNRCLNALRTRGRRPRVTWSLPDLELPEPSGMEEVTWLEPYPDALLPEGASDPGPDARYEAREAISLAFVTALQVLSPRQRAVLILRDVLGYHAEEVAGMLDATVESVTSALKRARARLQRRIDERAPREPPPPPGSRAEQELAARLTRAYEVGDVSLLVALLTDDVQVTMPPVPLEYRGRELSARFHAAVTFRQSRTYALVPTRANGQLAYGAYVREPGGGPAPAMGLLVFTLAGEQVAGITRFDTSLLAPFGLPERWPA